MKLMFVIVALVLASCSTPFTHNTQRYTIMNQELSIAWEKVSAMKFMPENDGENYCKSPNEFFRDGGGDCEDFTAALMYLLGPESEAVRIQTKSGPHYIVRYQSSYIEPQKYKKYPTVPQNVILDVYSYTFMMEWATACGTKNIMSFHISETSSLILYN